MCFKRKQSLEPPIKNHSVIVCQLRTEELQESYKDITRFGAAYSIKFKEKEDTLMVEKLKAYRDELIAKIEEIKGTDHNAEIDAKVAEFRAKLVAEIEDAADKELAKLNSDVECINGLIAREEAEIEAKTVEAVIEGPVENSVNSIELL